MQILENYTLLATKQKSNVDKAMQSFIEMLEEDKDYLPAVLGMSTGFMIEKSQVCVAFSTTSPKAAFFLKPPRSTRRGIC